MDDIRLFETDGDYLVLEAQDGQKYRLLIDESVRASIKREPQQLLDSVSITPREIQDEIRNGATIDDLVKRSGAPFDYIEKFAAPVIAELKHMVDSALSVRLTIAGDRYSETNQIEFGEIINSRLVTSGASGIYWSAERLEPMRWHITANYQLTGAAGSATWSFDPRHLTLSPESETAVTLSSQETLNNSVIPKLKTVEHSPQQETQVFEDVIPIGRGAVEETPVAVAPVVDIAPEPEFAPVASAPVSIPAPKSNAEPESLSATADLLEALRRKRNERSETNLEAHPATQGLRVIDIEAPVAEPEPVAVGTEPQSNEVEESTEESKPAASRKGRAAMPSWDEIVFGTKAED
jgi:hypothetical protein